MLPRSGEMKRLPISEVEDFNPLDYPRQISSAERGRIKARGETPMDEVRKVCNTCLKLKDVSEFSVNQTRKDGSSIHRPACMECRAGIDGVRKIPTRTDGKVPEKPAMGTYWTCPVCLHPGIVDVTFKLVLDHDHLTGYAREYICDRCNTELGRFRNGENLIRRAAEYVKKYEDS